VVAAADRILAPTSGEAEDLVELYGADPSRIRVVTPGVNSRVFSPRPRREARARLHLSNARLLLFVGRLQRFKGPDVAILAVAAAAGGLRDVVVDGRTGLLVEGHDPHAYGEAIVRLLRDRRLAGRLGRAAARHGSRFSWDATAEGVRDVYRELLTRHAG